MAGAKTHRGAPWLLLGFAAVVLLACLWHAPPRLGTERAEDGAATVSSSAAAAPTARTAVAEHRTARAGQPPAVVPQLDFDALVNELVELHVMAQESAVDGDMARVRELDAQGRPVLEQILRGTEEPAFRALHALTGLLSEDDSDHGLARRQVLLAILGISLDRKGALFLRGGSRKPLDSLVMSMLHCIPQDELLAVELSDLLIDQHYLGVAHEAPVLDLVATAANEKFLLPIAQALLETLWNNLRASGALTQSELLNLALLFRKDANRSKRAAAIKHLLMADDGRYRELVVHELIASRDAELIDEMTMPIANELPPRVALQTLERLRLVSDKQMIAAFLMLGHRDSRLLIDAYEQQLANGSRPDLRAELVTGAGFEGGKAGLEIARLAFYNDPDIRVRERALFPLTGSGSTAAEGERILMAAVDDPRLGKDPLWLETVVLALGNLAARGDPNAVRRVARRLTATGLLTDNSKRELKKLLDAIPAAGK